MEILLHVTHHPAILNTTARYYVRKEELKDNPLLSLRYQDG